MILAEDFDHLVLHVRDPDVSAAWYEKALGMRRYSFKASDGGSTRQSVSFGRRKINLRPIDACPKEWFTAKNPCVGSSDLCFIAKQKPEVVVAHFHSCGIEVVDGPVVKQGAQGKMKSVYVLDPDGSLIEVCSYDAISEK